MSSGHLPRVDASNRGGRQTHLLLVPVGGDQFAPGGRHRLIHSTSLGGDAAAVPPPQGPWSRATITPPPAELPTFLTDTTSRGPEPTGWNGFLHRLGFKTGPTDEQKRRWSDERAVSQHWAGPRTIAVVNGKGGSTKTPTTAMISAVFARYGGSGVCAWDANFTRGTLGWRTEQGPHDRTVLELVPHLDELRSPSANSADLAGYLHHQTQDKYDVLRSNPPTAQTAADDPPGAAGRHSRAPHQALSAGVH